VEKIPFAKKSRSDDMAHYIMILYQFLGIFDIIISLFWAGILGDIISK
jgi:hypothetical protein